MNVAGAKNFVDIRNLRYRVGGRLLLDGVSLTAPAGKITAIIGPSGSGKTTLLRLICGQLAPLSGLVLLDGLQVATLSRRQLFALRKRMGVLFQSAALFTDLSAFENVAFPLRIHTRLPEPALRARALEKLHAVGLRGAWRLMPNELSGGMARRVALARAVALDPDLILYDEPFAGQDPIAMGVLMQLIRSLNAQPGVTSLLVSHDIHETLAIADRIHLLCDGRIVASGDAQALRANPDPLVRQFIHGLADGPAPFHYPQEAPQQATKP